MTMAEELQFEEIHMDLEMLLQAELYDLSNFAIMYRLKEEASL